MEIGAFEAKNTLGHLLDLVESGEEILITRHGTPVARLVAPAEAPDRAPARAAAQRIRQRGKERADLDWRNYNRERKRR
jgi:prevent-host-death family protein